MCTTLVSRRASAQLHRSQWPHVKRLTASASLIVLAALPSGAEGLSSIELPHDPSHAERPVEWCAYHLARKELVAALSDCNYAVAQNPKSAAALSNRGSVWLIAGESKRSLRDFDAALKITPADASLHYNRGIALSNLGLSHEAIADFGEAIRLRPNFAIAHHNRGYEYERLLRRDEALADYRRALQLDASLKPPADAIRRMEKFSQ